MAKAGTSPWDLTALFNAADPKAGDRRAPSVGDPPGRVAAPRAARAEPAPRPAARRRRCCACASCSACSSATRRTALRAAEMLRLFLREVDSAALLADFGFAPRTGLWAEFGIRLRARLLPLTPATSDLGELFALLFPRGQDIAWLNAIDDETLARLARVLEAGDTGLAHDWRGPFFEAITFLASSVRAAGFSAQLRQRMSPELLVDAPFHQLARVAEQLREHGESTRPEDRALFLQDAQYLRALLDTCRRCAASVHDHLEAHGVSVDVVFEVDQLRERAHRIDLLLGCVLAPEASREIVGLVAELAAHGRGPALDPRPVRAPLLAAGAQGRRAQRRQRRALHHPRPGRVRGDAARRRRRRRCARRRRPSSSSRSARSRSARSGAASRPA